MDVSVCFFVVALFEECAYWVGPIGLIAWFFVLFSFPVDPPAAEREPKVRGRQHAETGSGQRRLPSPDRYHRNVGHERAGLLLFPILVPRALTY